MQLRRTMSQRVLSGYLSASEAARQFGVSRPTVYRWVKRAQQVGVSLMQEASRRPQHVSRQTPVEVEALVLAQKQARRIWGAKKIHAELWPADLVPEAPVCVRTVDRMLARHQQVQPRGALAQAQALQRFERACCNELWQMDFKGVPRRLGYYPLSILDDHSRFLLGLQPLASRCTDSVWDALWEVFGEYGLPACILTDNGDAFHSISSAGPTLFEARLWRLGVQTTHGKPAHPQTQGKVERLHRTLDEEYADALEQPTLELARLACQQVRQDYNWCRPHEALGMRTPGSTYVPSSRPRPDVLPEAYLADGTPKRKVDAYGKFSFRGHTYRAGRGLAGEWVEVRQEEAAYILYYANVPIGDLERLQV